MFCRTVGLTGRCPASARGNGTVRAVVGLPFHEGVCGRLAADNKSETFIELSCSILVQDTQSQRNSHVLCVILLPSHDFCSYASSLELRQQLDFSQKDVVFANVTTEAADGHPVQVDHFMRGRAPALIKERVLLRFIPDTKLTDDNISVRLVMNLPAEGLVAVVCVSQ